MDKKTLIITGFLFLLLIPFLYAFIPGDWWGTVTINGNTGNGAIVDTYISGSKVASAIVGQYVSEYYLIHVPGKSGDLIQFKVNGKDAGSLQEWIFGSHRLDFSVDIEEEPEEPNEEGYNLSLFDDLDTCKLGMVGDLDLKLKEPDEGDEFKPGEEIEIEIEVENNADEDKDVVVEVVLYNINEDDVEEETDDEKEIRDGRDETFEFVFEVPDDFENDNYLIYVKAYEDGEEESQCVEGAIEIGLEREKHDVIIKEFSINPSSVIAGKSFDVFTEIQNVGESDEDVYVVVEIKELGVLTESETFELEEFGEDDSFSETFSIKIPDNAEKGDYDIIIRAIFDGDEDEKTETISVLEKVPIELNPIVLTVKEEKPEKVPEVQKPQKISEISSIIPIGLFIGIIILIILIVIVARKR